MNGLDVWNVLKSTKSLMIMPDTSIGRFNPTVFYMDDID